MNRLIVGAIVLGQGVVVVQVAAADTAPACRYSPNGDLITIVKGATSERMALKSAATASGGTTDCGALLGTATALSANGKEIHVTVYPNDPEAIRLSAIPTDLNTGSTTWNVIDARGVTIGTADLPVDGFTVGASLGVTYNGSDASLRQNGTSVTENNLGVAVVGRTVVNEARMVVPGGIQGASDSQNYWEIAQSDWGDNALFENCTSEVSYLNALKTLTDFKTLRLKATAPADMAVAQARSTAAQSQVDGILETDRKVKKPRTEAINSSRCVLPTVSRLTFAVTKAKSLPLGVRLRLVSVTGGDTLLEIYPTISGRAQIETIGLPISGAISINCDDSLSAYNGGTIPVTEDNLAVGACAVQFDYHRLPFDVQQNLSDYGPQDLLISVHKSGDESANDNSKAVPLTAGFQPVDPTKPTLNWITDAAPLPKDPVKIASLPLPKGNLDPDGVYQVRVALNTGTTSTVVYRPGRAGAASPTDEEAFSATVRVTGEYALPIRSHLRVFATIPVNIFGVRFPAAPADLQSSSDSRVYQSAPIKAGVMIGAEPWNYYTARDDWPLKPRLLVGMNLVNLENGAFTPSLLAGLAATLPVVDSASQVGTSVAMGLFWEFDLREDRPFADHGHVLFTVGFNILSLGTPK